MCNRKFAMNNVCIHFSERLCSFYKIRHNTGLGKVEGTGKEQMSEGCNEEEEARNKVKCQIDAIG